MLHRSAGSSATLPATRRSPLAALRVTILDRYVVAELGGPFAFGMSAFTLIFVATQILAIGRLVSEEHAPLWAAVAYFLWQMPGVLLLVIPMAMLLGTLLAMQRLSGESEITAMGAGGVSLARVVAPLLGVGILVSLFSLVLQETFVPYANDRAAFVRNAAIQHLSPVAANVTVVTPLPAGGRQVTIAGALDPGSQALRDVTVLRYNARGHLDEIVVAGRAEYLEPSWAFRDATIYHFGTNPEDVGVERAPSTRIDVGERPNQIAKQTGITNPEEMSRREIRDALRSGQLAPQQAAVFTATYAAKLARPFAAFVFALIAVPFGIRPIRGGGTGLGFGLAVAIVFVYYVISTIALSIGSAAPALAGVAAWTPNLLFTAIGAALLRRSSAV